MPKGYPINPEVMRAKLRAKRLGSLNPFYGKKHTPETIQKIKESLIGNKHNLGNKASAETRKKMSVIHKGNTYCLGNKLSVEQKKKISIAMKGRVFSSETRIKMGLHQKGEKSHRWKGGVSSVNKLIRESVEYKLWRESVFKRDNYMCVIGGKNHSKKLNADHIKPFALFPALRFDINNGRTLCEPCHKATDTYGNKKIYGKNV